MHGRRAIANVVQFDGDGQHRLEDIKSMKEKMDEGYDIVIGSRFENREESWSMEDAWKPADRTAIWLTTRAKIKDPTSGTPSFQQEDEKGICLEF